MMILDMVEPTGFDYQRRKNGDVVITHHRKVVVTLRGQNADQFMVRIERDDPQHVMARATGNYKRGNER